MRKIRLLFCAGGTGGHIIPALVVADRIKSIYPKVEIVFLTGRRPIDRCILSETPYRTIHLPLKKGVSGVGSTLSFILGTVLSFNPSLLHSVASSHAVVTTGSYVAFPVSVCAFLLRRPVYLIEPNAYPGRFIRLFGHYCRRVFGGWQSLRRYLGDLNERLRIVGVPLREEIEASPDRLTARRLLGIEEDATVLLVLGGSQGADALNSFILKHIQILKDSVPELFVLHITGSGDSRKIRLRYEKAGVGYSVFEWCSQIWNLYAASDVVLARAGALTLAELLKVRKTAVVVPHPYTADDHQNRNAEEVKRMGLIHIVQQSELDDEGIRRLLYILKDKKRRIKLEEASTKNDSVVTANVQIAEEIVRDILEGGRDGKIGEVTSNRCTGTLVFSSSSS